MTHRSPLVAACLAAAVTLLVPATAHAQCLGPDNLSGNCWEPTDANLPDFPDIFMSSGAICWDDCDPIVQDPSVVSFSPPAPLRCAEFGSQVTVSTGAGTPVLSGFARLNYTRTWFETNLVTLQQWQVWRLLLKIDLSEAFGAPPVCWNPPCLNAAGDTCFWYGYVDYAQECSTGVWDNAVVMYHACDAFTHNMFLSANPAPAAGFHPTSYYAIVAPDFGPNPFSPLPIASPRTGLMPVEAVRNVDAINPAGICVKEERLTSGAHQLLGEACLCPISFATPRQSASRLTGIGSCADATGLPSSFLSFGIFNPTFDFNWFEMIATSLGSWTTPFAYPGEETASVEEGFFVYHDSCAANFGLPADTLDIMYGSKTTGGFVADDPFGIALSTNFLDLGSNYSEPSVILPLIGVVNDTDHLIYANID